MTKNPYRFSLIGPGRVGSSVAMALVRMGWTCKSIMYKDRTGTMSRKLKSSFLDARIVDRNSLMQDDFRVLLITVQDDEIQNVVDKLSANKYINWNSKVVLHVSGVKRVEILSPLRKRGAAIGALHPAAAFAAEYQPSAAFAICYDFFGDAAAFNAAQQITKRLKSKLIHLRSERQRVLLHIASAIASNSTVVAVRSAERLISNFLSQADAKMLIQGLLDSTIKNLSTNNGMISLTGPLARGDFGVIREHIKALENDKTLLQFYRSWSLLGVELLLEDKHTRDGFSRERRTAMTKIKKLVENK